MNLDKLHIGKNVPDEVNVVIEIPAQGEPVKYELDKESGGLVVDRFFGTAMHYPCNYGFVPHTLSEDGDPVDVLVITRVPLLNSAIIAVRPVGMLKMEDESGIDAKIIAVPIDKLTRQYKDVHELEDLPETFLHEISHFFEQYKALEPGKWAKVDGWADTAAAKQEILDSVARYENEAQ